MRSLEGSTVVISGAASGIGLATAETAVELGANVALLDRAGPVVNEIAARLSSKGAAIGIECDVTKPDQISAAVAGVVERFGEIHGLVTSAGVEKGAPSHLVPLEDWRTTLEVNLTGTFLLCQAVIARRAQESTDQLSIVCLSSPAGFVGFADGENAAYSASKGGVSALVRTLAIEYASRGIRVNAVVPGSTETPLMWANVDEADIDTVRKEVEEAIPLGRLADPSEIAEAIVWLLGAQSKYVTGTHLICDGGLLAKSAISV
jgi:NAD(P)-dependent dehydrogenase (short-subunit alcohol dehydrogenase family)